MRTSSGSRVGKTLLWIIFVFLILLIGVIAVFPKVVSTEKGKNVFLNIINKNIPGKISVEKIQLNWFGGQKIEHLLFTDNNGKTIFKFETFSADESLFALLFSKTLTIGKTEIISPYLLIEEDKEGNVNVKKALGLKEKQETKEKKKEPFCQKFKGELIIQKGTLEFSSPKITTISLKDINVSAKDCFALFHVTAKTIQGSKQGEISAQGEVNDNVHIVASVHNFPVALLDQLKETALYEAAFGANLDFDLEILKKENHLTLQAKISSPNLQGTLQGVTKEQTFYLEKGDVLFTVTPAFFKAYFKTKEWELANRPIMTLHIDKLILPLELSTPNFHKIPLLGKLTVERGELTHAKLGPFSVNDAKAFFETSENAIDIKYSAGIQGKGEATTLNGIVNIFSDETVSFSTNFTALPTDFLELILSAEMPYLHKILGDKFSLSCQGVYNSEVDATLSLSSPKLQLDGTVNGPSLETLTAKLEGDAIFPVRYTPFLGRSPHLKIEADFSYEDRNLIFPYLSIKMKNSHLDFDIVGNIGKKGKNFSYEDVFLSGRGRILHLPLYSSGLDYQGNVFLEFDGGKNTLDGQSYLTTVPNDEEAVNLKFYAKNIIVDNELKLDEGEVLVDAKVSKFPVHFFDTFFNYKVKLYPLIGSHLNLDMHLHREAGKEARLTTVDIDANSYGFLMQLSLTVDGFFNINQNKPAFIHWDLTQQRYKYLIELAGEDKRSEYSLFESSKVDLIIEGLTCPKGPFENPKAIFCEGGFIGRLEMTPLIFMNPKTEEKITFNNIRGHISAEQFSKFITLQISSQIDDPLIPVPENEKRGVSLTLEAKDLLTHEGKFNKENVSVKEDLAIDFIPVQAFTGIIPLKPDTRKMLRALLGDVMNARIYGEISKLEGPLTIDIKASNFKGIFPLQFTKESVTLRKTVETELTLTQQVNEVLLKDVNPILIHGAWSEHPIRVYIDAEGFFIPLRPYSFKEVVVQRAVIDFGRLRVKNGGEILTLMKFLKAKEITDEGIMEAWFTPIFMNLKDGVATYKRFDALLAGNVHIALWGKIDLVKDKVRMTLGISPSTLQRSLNIKGLSKKEMFQVKMRGSTSDLELDWSSAYTRIGILLTRSAGHIGNIVGGILEKFVGVFGEEPTPDPTISPFPWENRKNYTPSTTMPQEVSWKEEPNAGLLKIYHFFIP